MKKYNKGFTLVELVAIIIIIGVVSLIVTPIVINVIENSKNEAYNVTVENIEEAAKNYSIYNDIGYNTTYGVIELSVLQEKGYLKDEDIFDPRTDLQMQGCVLYRWLLDSKQYEFTYSEDCNINQEYPKLEIITNDNNKEWMNELLTFEINGGYDSYKYCIGENNCTVETDYNGKVYVPNTGKGIYVCATGYENENVGETKCTKGFNIDPNKPEITSNKVATTSSKIVVTATCEDDISLVKEIKYSINDLEYQTSNIFTNLKTGEYKVKTKCVDNALNETVVEETKSLTMAAPTITQISQIPVIGEWAQKRVMRITYISEGVEEPKHYYSLDGNDWIEVTGITKDVEFTSNGYLYAKTVDNAGNVASSAVKAITNIDNTKPNVNISISSIKTDRITVTAICDDPESGIMKYEFSKDNGASWTSYGSAGYTFTGLNQNTEYRFRVRCTNGAGIENTANGVNRTSSIIAPTISLLSKYPTDTTYSQNKVIRITYDGTNIENPKYYYSYNNSVWIESSSLTKDIEFTFDGYLYAKTVDEKGNIAASSAYSVVYIDEENPYITTAVTDKSVALYMSDNYELVGYTITNSTDVPTNWTSISGRVKEYDTVWLASENGTYYAWVKDASGRTSYSAFTIKVSSCAYDIGYEWTYKYTGKIQEFTTPCAGTYTLELWGGKGGESSYVDNGAGTCSKQNYNAPTEAYGGYTTGQFRFTKDQILYVVVGGEGNLGSIPTDEVSAGCPANTGSGGYNGGKAGSSTGSSGSGGATHISLVSEKYSSDLASSENLLISAKGGSGSKTTGYYSSDKKITVSGGGANFINTNSVYYVGGENIVSNDKTKTSYVIITYDGE